MSDEPLIKTEVVFGEDGVATTITRELTADEVVEYEAGQVPEPATDQQINMERERRVLAGRAFTIPGIGPVAVAGDDETRSNLQALALQAFIRQASGDTSTIVPYRDRENVVHSLNPSQILALFEAASSYVSQLYQASWSLKVTRPNNFRDDSQWP